MIKSYPVFIIKDNLVNISDISSASTFAIDFDKSQSNEGNSVSNIGLNLRDCHGPLINNNAIDVYVNTGGDSINDCKNKQDCLLGNFYKREEVVHQATIMSEGKNFFYIGSTTSCIKKRISNHYFSLSGQGFFHQSQ